MGIHMRHQDLKPRVILGYLMMVRPGYMRPCLKKENLDKAWLVSREQSQIPAWFDDEVCNSFIVLLPLLLFNKISETILTQYFDNTEDKKNMTLAITLGTESLFVPIKQRWSKIPLWRTASQRLSLAAIGEAVLRTLVAHTWARFISPATALAFAYYHEGSEPA